MKSRAWIHLSPAGTARQRLGLDEADDEQALSALFRRLAAGALEHDLGDDSLYLAEELVRLRLRWTGALEREAMAMLLLASIISAREGSTCLPLDRGKGAPLRRIVGALGRAAGLDRAAVGRLLKEIERQAGDAMSFHQLIGRPGEYRPLIACGDRIYQHRLLWCEDRLAAAVRARLQRPHRTAEGLPEALADVAARPPYRGDAATRLSDEQARAVERAASAPLTLIAGGPGTGKTAIVVSILRALVRIGVPVDGIALAAPTGKAANRMAQSIAAALDGVHEPAPADLSLVAAMPVPQTLHRLLGYQPARDVFRHDQHNPLPASVVIVDEASMIDLAMAERLLRAVAGDARVVLLGDHHQLPSVDAGAVFRDLVAALPDRAVQLTHSYRMDARDPAGRAVLEAAREVDDGGHRAALATRRATPRDLRYSGVEHYDGDLSRFLASWFERRIAGEPEYPRLAGRVYRLRAGRFDDEDAAALSRLARIFDRARILTVTRRQTRGAEAINRALHQRVLAGATIDEHVELYPGEPVLMRHNDYQRGLFNGDQGLVVRVSEDGGRQHFRVVFPIGAPGDEPRHAVFHPGAIRHQIEHAFAMTVHKSQGSELDHVAIVLPPTDVPLLTREMLYTAITRARTSAVLVGSAALVKKAATRGIERYSGLADKIR